MVVYTFAFTRNAEMLSESGGCAWLFCATAVRGLACHACFMLFEQSKLLDTNCSETEYSHESVSSTKSPRRPKRMKSLKKQECPYDSVIYKNLRTNRGTV